MAARVISVPDVVGREAEGMGAGPLALAGPVAAALHAGDVRVRDAALAVVDAVAGALR